MVAFLLHVMVNEDSCNNNRCATHQMIQWSVNNIKIIIKWPIHDLINDSHAIHAFLLHTWILIIGYLTLIKFHSLCMKSTKSKLLVWTCIYMKTIYINGFHKINSFIKNQNIEINFLSIFRLSTVGIVVQNCYHQNTYSDHCVLTTCWSEIVPLLVTPTHPPNKPQASASGLQVEKKIMLPLVYIL